MTRSDRYAQGIRGSAVRGSVVVVSILVLHAGCGGGSVGGAAPDGGAFDLDAGTDAATADASANVTLTLSPATLRIGTDQHASVHATLARSAGFSSPVILEATAMGINPLDAEIGAGGTEADLAVWATSTTDVETDVVVRAIVQGKEITRSSFHLSVAGVTTGLDGSFGELGIATKQVLTGLRPSANPVGVVVRSDGAVIVAGNASGNEADPPKLFLARFTEAGQLDASFAGGGVSQTTARDAQAAALTVDGAGKLVLAANGLSSSPGVLLRYAADGEVDTTFDTTGAAEFASARFNAVLPLPDGSVFGGGSAGSGKLAFALGKSDATGAPDTSIGNGGVVSFPVGSGSATITHLERDATSRVFAGGPAAGAGYAIACLSTSSAFDTTFGAGGIRVIEGATPKTTFARLPDGKLLVVGSAPQSGKPRPNTLTFTRLTSDGAVDTAFGISGRTTVESELELADLALTNDGKLYVVGKTLQGHIGIARYTVAGELDTSFGVNGTLASGATSSGGARAVAVAPDGKIVVVGSFGSSMAVLRYLP